MNAANSSTESSASMIAPQTQDSQLPLIVGLALSYTPHNTNIPVPRSAHAAPPDLQQLPTLHKPLQGPVPVEAASGTVQWQNAILGEIDLIDQTIQLASLRLDGGTQARAAMDAAAIAEYTEAIQQGATMPPLVVFFDGVAFWLADGYHRFHAYRAAAIAQAAAEVRNGSRREAVLFSVGANAVHGLRRSNADKRHSVETLLADDEWCKWSDREIARQCNVGAPLVADVRKAICNPITDASAAIAENPQDSSATRTVKRNGKEYLQQTKKIGKAVRKDSKFTPSAGPAATSDFQLSNAKHAASEENADAPDTDLLPKALDELATCRKQLCAAQELITTVQNENAKLIQEIKILNALLEARACDRIDAACDDSISHAASEE